MQFQGKITVLNHSFLDKKVLIVQFILHSLHG